MLVSGDHDYLFQKVSISQFLSFFCLKESFVLIPFKSALQNSLLKKKHQTDLKAFP